LSDLLSAEERTALQEPYQATGSRAPVVALAQFPDVSQMAPDRTSALNAALKRWMDPVLKELTRQLRVSCEPRPPFHQSVARHLMPLPDDQAFWATIEGCPGTGSGATDGVVLLTLPRRFAASMCERIFGAPLELRPDRPLTAAEVKLLRQLAGQWLGLATFAWPGRALRLCDEPEEEADGGEIASAEPDWIRMTTEFACGPVEGAVSVTLPPSTARLLLGEQFPVRYERLVPSDLSARLGEVPLELRAVLGQAEFSLDELTSLRIGDIIALDRRAEDPVEILIDDRIFFRARAGMAGQWVAFELIGQPLRETSHGG
jgi:flagellar motor switch/type III secretory pathway protein FliN